MGSSKETKYKVRCYYEVLEVERNADEEDIRQAYRKLARKWHPDKNLDNPEEADLRFKEIQNAYGVLSDPNERAWYDSHREQILMGGDPTDGSFEGLNVWEYFNSDCYDDFDDSEEGFYTVYRKVFDTLAAEEEKFDEDHKIKASDIPSFGKKNSEAKEVNAFYNFWLRFSSQKSFSWKDVYRTSDAPNREVRRVIEKENKKERDKARKAFNDLMRKFVEFVRKKDPRITQMLKAERLRKKQEEEQRAAQRAEQKRIHEENRAAYQKESAAIMDSIQFDEADHEMLGIKTKPKKNARQQQHEDDAEGNADDVPPEFDDEDEDVEQQLYCMACRKKFKSDKQYQNHENSKKHKENVAILKAEVMLDDEIEQFLQDQHDLDEQLHQIQEEQEGDTAASQDKDSSFADDNDADMNDPEMLEMLAKLKVAHVSEPNPTPAAEEQTEPDAVQPQSSKKDEEKNKKDSDNEDDEEEDDGDEDFFLQAMMAKSQQKSKKQQKKAKKASARNAFSVLMDDVADYEDHLESMKAKNSDDDEEEDDDEKPQIKEPPKAVASVESDEDEEEEPQKKSPAPNASKASPASPQSNNSSPAGSAKKQQQKKRRRKAKGGAAEETEAPKAEEFKCRVCQEVYPTRNELFQHLKDSKHASAK